MCDSCKDYFRELAKADGKSIVISDPDGVRVFRPNGDVWVVHGNNTVTRYIDGTPAREL